MCLSFPFLLLCLRYKDVTIFTTSMIARKSITNKVAGIILNFIKPAVNLCATLKVYTTFVCNSDMSFKETVNKNTHSQVSQGKKRINHQTELDDHPISSPTKKEDLVEKRTCKALILHIHYSGKWYQRSSCAGILL